MKQGIRSKRDVKTGANKKFKSPIEKIQLLTSKVSKMPVYATSYLPFDSSRLTENQKNCLKELIQAAKSIDRIYWKQNTPHGLEIKEFLDEAINYVDGKIKSQAEEYLTYLSLFYGNYDPVNGEKKFIPDFTVMELINALDGTPKNVKARLTYRFGKLTLAIFSGEGNEKPEGANVYAVGLTKEEIETHIKQSENPEKTKKNVEKINTIIRLETEGQATKLKIVPYEQEFKDELKEAAGHLLKAGEFSDDPAFKRYLTQRAKALLSGNFKKSDTTWVKLDSPDINIVIGPIETYLDKTMGNKGAYEAMITVKNKEETEKVNILRGMANDFEKHLPCADEYKNDKPRLPALDMVDVVFYSGEAGVGSSTPIAWNLPNDKEVTEKDGFRVTQTINVTKTKDNAGPGRLIAESVLDQKLLKEFSQEERIKAFTIWVMLHEFSHGNGRTIKVESDGSIQSVDPRTALQDCYSYIEEAKADTVGFYHMPFLVEKGFISEKEKQAAYVSMIPRVLKFMYSDPEIKEAHSIAETIRFNYLVDFGAIRLVNGRYTIDMEKTEQGITQLAKELLTIKGEGNQTAAKQLKEKYGHIKPETKVVLDTLPPDLPKFVSLRYPTI